SRSAELDAEQLLTDEDQGTREDQLAPTNAHVGAVRAAEILEKHPVVVADDPTVCARHVAVIGEGDLAALAADADAVVLDRVGRDDPFGADHDADPTPVGWVWAAHAL